MEVPTVSLRGSSLQTHNHLWLGITVIRNWRFVMRRNDKLDDQRARISREEQPNALLTHYRLIVKVKKVFQVSSARKLLRVFSFCGFF